jgi:hypothetical protein
MNSTLCKLQQSALDAVRRDEGVAQQQFIRYRLALGWWLRAGKVTFSADRLNNYNQSDRLLNFSNNITGTGPYASFSVHSLSNNTR